MIPPCCCRRLSTWAASDGFIVPTGYSQTSLVLTSSIHLSDSLWEAKNHRKSNCGVRERSDFEATGITAVVQDECRSVSKRLFRGRNFDLFPRSSGVPALILSVIKGDFFTRLVYAGI